MFTMWINNRRIFRDASDIWRGHFFFLLLIVGEWVWPTDIGSKRLVLQSLVYFFDWKISHELNLFQFKYQLWINLYLSILREFYVSEGKQFFYIEIYCCLFSPSISSYFLTLRVFSLDIFSYSVQQQSLTTVLSCLNSSSGSQQSLQIWITCIQ